MKRYCLALDLVNDADSIKAYEDWHSTASFPPEIKQSIYGSGISSMEIFRTGNRLFMIIEATDDFSFERKAEMDAANDKVQAWEKLMDGFQARLPWAKADEKWVLMNSIFKI